MIYVSLLRGINVSGQKAIKMSDLAVLFQSLRFKNISTYLQSGNVLFEFEDTNPRQLENLIKQAIIEKYNFEVSVIVKSVDEFAKTFVNNPFLNKKNVDIEKLHVTFLMDAQEDTNNIDFSKEANEEYKIVDSEVYLYCPNGYGRTKLTNQVFERKLKTVATTRNWKTVSSLIAMAKEKYSFVE